MEINTSKKLLSAKLNELLIQFKLEEKIYAFESLNSGLINDTYLVFDANTPKYIIQRINNGVFSNIEGLMRNIDNALKLLKSNDYTQIKLIKTKLGKTYLSNENGFWRVMTYIKGSSTFDTTTSTEVAFEAGRIIGSFHQLMQASDPKTYSDTIPKFHNLELRKMQFLAALGRSSKTKLEKAKSSILFAQTTIANLEKMRMENPPIRICHNDTKLNNILFCKNSKKALCLIDLDTLMKGYFHYDFGDAVRTIVNTAPEDEKVHTNITFDTVLFEAFLKGITDNSLLLSKIEIKALPYGVLLMPFLHGLRALTDYLNNNTYYKVTYDLQNLDRCQSLFYFTNKAFDNLNYMKQTIQTHFKT